MRANSVVEVIQPANAITLYSPPEAFELFYLYKVINVRVGPELLTDKFNRLIGIGLQYIKYQYLNMIKEKKLKIYYKIFVLHLKLGI